MIFPQCLFDGLKKASRAIYGKEDLLGLLLSTDYIRYSTTQGTNALVERKGPRLGVIFGGGLSGASTAGQPPRSASCSEHSSASGSASSRSR